MAKSYLSDIANNIETLRKHWEHNGTRGNSHSIILSFGKSLDITNPEFTATEKNNSALVLEIYKYTERHTQLSDDEILKLARAVSYFIMLKCSVSGQIQVSPNNEHVFFSFYSGTLEQNHSFQEAIDFTRDFTYQRYGLEIEKLKELSAVFSKNRSQLETSLSEYNQTAQKDFQDALSNMEITSKAQYELLLKKIDKEKNSLNKLILKYQQVSSGALTSLSRAFRTAKKIKRTEMDGWKKTSRNLGIAALGFALICILIHPAGDFLTTFKESETIGAFITNYFSGSLVYLLIFEGLLIYFFRIALNNFHASRDELMQLEIREALCKFAPTYTAFADPNDNRLENFSKHIFSPIISKLNPAPHPFDFLGQVGQAVNNIKKK
ncbi:MAG: hypothetical protein ACERJ1_16665 [Halodesulfovibrio sp.]|uniref:hypothetical protein n=1 Tax=Halodesulfovibrio sp. TaxID=1912772 RepID=UPI00359CDF46